MDFISNRKLPGRGPREWEYDDAGSKIIVVNLAIAKCNEKNVGVPGERPHLLLMETHNMHEYHILSIPNLNFLFFCANSKKIARSNIRDGKIQSLLGEVSQR